MSDELDRRQFLSTAWKVGLGFVGVAGVWTSYDLLWPGSAGAGAEVRTVETGAVPAEGVLEVPAARAYLTRVGDEIVALSEKCPHLGCRVPFCESSGQFECPCHGSVFNRIGEFREGPSPRGMDRYPVSVVDGYVVLDTGNQEKGAPAGDPETIDEPPTGPSCA
jgi:cytochrome b6-f complex iron-sulfur subunit